MTVQRGIVDPNQAHLLVMTFDLVDAGVAAGRLENFWSDVNERLHDWYAPFRLTITMGFGSPIFGTLGKLDVMPPGLRLMPGWDGDAFTPADAQADVLVQVACDHRGVLNTVERDIRRLLAPAFAIRDHEVGFGMTGSRGLLGFVDGTGNPHGDAAALAAFIGDEDPAREGGSFMVFRKIVEDLDDWERLSVDEQERSIGRRKADSAPYDPPESTPATSHRAKSSAAGPHGDIEMLRRSYPFAGRDEAGLLFICFVRDLDQFEVIKTQMASAKNVDGSAPGVDAIHQRSKPVSGGYYYVPPVPADGHVGDLLFGG
jgi:putative iron-dependent peroxidase